MTRFAPAAAASAPAPAATTLGAVLRALVTADVIPLLAGGFMTVSLISLAF